MRSSLAPVPLLAAGILAAGILAVSPAAHAVSPPHLVSDLATTVSPSEGSHPHGMARYGDRVVFAAQPDDFADRLFVTDGTAEGTRELAAVCPEGTPGSLQLLFTASERAYFHATCGEVSAALWASDGTPEGTARLRVSWEGGGETLEDPGGGLGELGRWTESGGSTYFLWGGIYSPLELWTTDGTTGGTERVWLSEEESTPLYAGIAPAPDGNLVFATWTGFQGEIGFWHSDGSSGGTYRNQSTPTYSGGFTPAFFQPISSGLLAWFAVDSFDKSEIWTSNGTWDGTRRLVELQSESSAFDAFGGVLEEGGSLYFVASSDGVRSLWRSDGTPESTRRILDVSGWGISTRSLLRLGDHFLIPRCATPYGEGCEFSRVPLTGSTASPFALYCDGVPCSEAGEWWHTTRLGSTIVFRTWSEERVALWATDGVSPDAVELIRFCDGSEACAGVCVWITGGEPDLLLTTGQDCEDPLESLWVSDGSHAGTFRLAADLGGSFYQLDGGFSRLSSGGWVFSASGRGPGNELWRAASRDDSAELLVDLRLDRPGLAKMEPIGEADGEPLFAALDALGSTSIVHRAPGSEGLDRLFTLPPYSRWDSPTLRSLRGYDAGDEWLFLEKSPFSSSDLYSTPEQAYRYLPATGELTTLFADPHVDGMGALSRDLVRSPHGYLFLGSAGLDSAPAILAWRPGEIVPRVLVELPAVTARSGGVTRDKWFIVEDELRLVAIDLARLSREILIEGPDSCGVSVYPLAEGALVTNIYGPLELLRTDGTAAGTESLGVFPWSDHFWCSSGFESAIDEPKGRGLFGINEDCGGTQHLWTADGSRARTLSLHSDPSWYPLLGGTVEFRGARYFRVFTWNPVPLGSSFALWRTDRTPTGTERASWLPSRSSLGWNETLAVGARALYFPWEDADHGRELWQSDGTAEGTRLVADLEPGPAGSNPENLVTLGDQVIFTATTSAHGTELWQVDGGSAEPELVADLYPGRASSDPELVLATPEALYYLADDGVVGRELWEITNPSAAPCVTDARTLCLEGGRFRVRALYREFAGRTGAAQAVPLTSDSGLFWFFDPGNPELVVKVVDACGLPGFENFWVYSTGLTNVEVELEVVDSWSGERKRVATGLGEPYLPDFDSGAFQVCTSVPLPPHLPEAPEITTVLPLLGGRFEATATWTTAAGDTGSGYAVPLSADSGYFWFFAPETLEILVKMVDACGEPGFENFWLFAGGLTDVQVHLSVRDSWSGQVVLHDNPLGHPFTPLLETGRFRVCDVPQP